MSFLIKAMPWKNLLKSSIHPFLSDNVNPCKLAQADCMFYGHDYIGIVNRYGVVSTNRAGPVTEDIKVCVIGAGGSVGSKVALLLKVSPLIKSLCLYDIKNEIEGVVDHKSSVRGVDVLTGPEKLTRALLGSKIVVICASSDKRSPGMTVTKVFEPNAAICYDLAKACVKTCPKAKIVLVSQPVESLLPLISEVYKEHYIYESRKLIGSTLSNIRRSTTLTAEDLTRSPFDLIVPVGGHLVKTMIPLFSRGYPDPLSHCGKAEKLSTMNRFFGRLTEKERIAVIEGTIHDVNSIVKNSDDWTVLKKKYQESAAVSAATSAASTALKMLQAMMNTDTKIPDCAYVKTDAVPGVTYSSTLVWYGPHGLVTRQSTHFKRPIEEELLPEDIDTLRRLIDIGEQYVRKRQ